MPQLDTLIEAINSGLSIGKPRLESYIINIEKTPKKYFSESSLEILQSRTHKIDIILKSITRLISLNTNDMKKGVHIRMGLWNPLPEKSRKALEAAISNKLSAPERAKV